MQFARGLYCTSFTIPLSSIVNININTEIEVRYGIISNSAFKVQQIAA